MVQPAQVGSPQRYEPLSTAHDDMWCEKQQELRSMQGHIAVMAEMAKQALLSHKDSTLATLFWSL